MCTTHSTIATVGRGKKVPVHKCPMEDSGEMVIGDVKVIANIVTCATSS